MAEKKPFLLRMEPEMLEALQLWANDELRSVNAQVEFLLREALRKAGRAKKSRDGRASPHKTGG